MIRLIPELPPLVPPDRIEVYGKYGDLLGVLLYKGLEDGHKGYAFHPNITRDPSRGIGGKTTLRQIADACERANRLRGTDY